MRKVVVEMYLIKNQGLVFLFSVQKRTYFGIFAYGDNMFRMSRCGRERERERQQFMKIYDRSIIV